MSTVSKYLYLVTTHLWLWLTTPLYPNVSSMASPLMREWAWSAGVLSRPPSQLTLRERRWKIQYLTMLLFCFCFVGSLDKLFSKCTSYEFFFLFLLWYFICFWIVIIIIASLCQNTFRMVFTLAICYSVYCINTEARLATF